MDSRVDANPFTVLRAMMENGSQTGLVGRGVYPEQGTGLPLAAG
jgi:hypothetical protein